MTSRKAFKPPVLTLPEWAVLSEAVHLVEGELLYDRGEVTRAELDAGWFYLRQLLRAEFGDDGPDSDGMVGLRVVMDRVWRDAMPSLKAARSRHRRQLDMFRPAEPTP